MKHLQNTSESVHAHQHDVKTEGHIIKGIAPVYDWIVNLISLGREKRLRNRTVELAEIRAGDDVLEVGCGTGSLTLAAKEHTGQAGRVYGIDPSAKMIEIAVRKAQKRGVDVAFQMGVIERIAFSDGEFDVVLSSLMFHHLPDEALKIEGIQESHRVLRPGGTLAIIDMEPTQWSLVGLIHGQSAAAANSPTRRLADLMEQSSFKNVQIKPVGIRGLGFVMGTK